MPRAGASSALLRDWVRRALAGYWTHAGYLNWDTGLGFQRWHQRKKVALAQRRADRRSRPSPSCSPSPRWGAWAKWLLDRGLREYARADRARRAGSRPRWPTACNVVPQSRGNGVPRRRALRRQRDARARGRPRPRAARARRRALYAFDPDTGRLAVTTPAYNTAIVAVNQRRASRTAASTSRGSSTPTRRSRRTSAGPGARVRAARAARCARSTARAARRVAAGAGARAARRGRDGRACARTPARSRTCACAAPSPPAGCAHRSEYRFTPAAIEGRWSVSGAAGARR